MAEEKRMLLVYNISKEIVERLNLHVNSQRVFICGHKIVNPNDLKRVMFKQYSLTLPEIREALFMIAIFAQKSEISTSVYAFKDFSGLHYFRLTGKRLGYRQSDYLQIQEIAELLSGVVNNG